MEYPWQVTPQKVQAAIQKIIAVSQPRQIIIFGSYVRAELNKNSDLDLLIITADNLQNTREESVRIRRALKGIPMAMDILVVTESKFAALCHTPGLTYQEVAKHGKVIYPYQTK
jgi:predicted nucleotidyltransferase